MHKSSLWMIRLALVFGLTAPGVWAQSAQPIASKGPDQIEDIMGRYNLHPAFEKLGRGLSNAFGGWMEVPFNVDKRYSKADTGGSFFTGLAYGVFKGAVRTGVGLYETVTFFLPYPENFVPILPTLPYFQKHTKRPPLLLE